jgi:hypothetical protein
LRKNKIALLIIILLQAVVGNFAFSQGIALDSNKCKNAIDNTIAYYNQIAGIQAGIYTGTDYHYERINSGHVFFESENFVNGNIVYDHIEYQAVPMLYDIVKDDVVIQGTFQPYFILLASNKVSQFSLSGHTFKRIISDSLTGSVIRTGFYQILYDGKIKALSKKKKILEEFIDIGNAFNTTAMEKDKWYIYKEGTYYEVQGKSSILKVLNDKKKEILQFSKQDKIRFKNNMDDALTRIVAYYDKITF